MDKEIVERLMLEVGQLPANLINLGVCLVLAVLLGAHYIAFGRSLSNRREFAINFLVVSLAITLIISIVKGSLTLSLGLVGALSIVRFRTPIKDPEELSYLFLSVAIGIGLGAGQPVATTVSILVILLILGVRSRLRKDERQGGLYLEINLPDEADPSTCLEQLTQLLSTEAGAARLRRFDTPGSGLMAAYSLGAASNSLSTLTRSIHATWPNAHVSVIDQDRFLDA